MSPFLRFLVAKKLDGWIISYNCFPYDLVKSDERVFPEAGILRIISVRMDKENRHITLAYFDQRSTVDYIGAVQGIPVCFDAKECSAQTFPLANIHPHQVKFMEDFEKQNGVAFFLIFFSQLNLFYYLPFRELLAYWRRMEEGGRKSFRREELDEKYYLPKKSGFLVPYLEGLKLDLETRVLP